MNDRKWLEERFQRLEDRFREENRAVESRITSQIADLKKTTTDRLNDHSKRIRSLENWRSWFTGLSAAAGAAGGWFARLLGDGRQ